MTKISKDDVAEISMMMITYSGVAKSLAVNSIEEATIGNYEKAFNLLIEAESNLKLAADEHFKAITADANNVMQIDVLFIHAEDQFMTSETMVLFSRKIIELVKSIIK